MPLSPENHQTSDTETSSQAALADRHRLYERAVQAPDAEVDFIDDRYRRLRGRGARRLREDFCGTAALCCEWVRRRKGNRAVGVDLDPAVLAWGRARNVGALDPETARRVTLVEGDVRATETGLADVLCAMNFSYWLLMDRDRLLAYFRGVRDRLADDGIFFLDAYGGYDSFRVITEEREIDDDEGRFTYIWEQASYEPVTGTMDCYIHFAFPDGSRMERAFSYRWRLWTLPEIRELLDEAGFRRVQVYWQGWDEDGEPDGDFQPTDSGEPDAGWICYLTAEKSAA
jgi:hypothetical protein